MTRLTPCRTLQSGLFCEVPIRLNLVILQLYNVGFGARDLCLRLRDLM